MERDARIWVTGHRGMLGRALVATLRGQGFSNLVLADRSQLDLTRQHDVEAWLAESRPEFVFHAAARAGGIGANREYPAQFIRDNLLIEANVIDAAWRNGARKLLFVASTCMYPENVAQPAREEYLMSGPLAHDTEPYGLAKLAGECLCRSYRRQYGFNAITVLPANLYGPGDNYDPSSSHVVAALIRRFHEAKISGASTVTIWGSGAPRREFLHVEDAAEGLVHLMAHYNDAMPVNLSPGYDISIIELAQMIRTLTGAVCDIQLDPTKPDGVLRKMTDTSRLSAAGWTPRISFQEGLTEAYRDYLARLGASAPGTA